MFVFIASIDDVIMIEVDVIVDDDGSMIEFVSSVDERKLLYYR